MIDPIEFLKQKIAEIKQTTPDNISFNDQTRLLDLGLDSLDVVELQMMYEEETGSETENHTDPVITVGDLLRLIK